MNWLYLSAVFNLVLAIVSLLLFRGVKNLFVRHVKEELRLKEIIIIREQQLMGEKMKVITSMAASSKPILDTKTKSLLDLALNNPNENEARSAAMQVCKRIKKTL